MVAFKDQSYCNLINFTSDRAWDMPSRLLTFILKRPPARERIGCAFRVKNVPSQEDTHHSSEDLVMHPGDGDRLHDGFGANVQRSPDCTGISAVLGLEPADK